MSVRDIEIESQEDTSNLQVKAPARSSGGFPAVVSALEHAWEEMGVWRGARVLSSLNQKGGFDCPSCAWPDPDVSRSRAEFCENGAKAVADEATTQRVGPEFFKQWDVATLSRKSDYWLGKQGRLTHPMWLREGSLHYEPIPWNDAFKLIARELNALASPNEAIFYTSGRTSNEAAFLYQLFVRQFGTNNLPDCSNMCHESSGAALTESLGFGKGSVTLEDFELAQVICVIGQNPGTNHPRMLSALQQARKNGCKIITINPLPEPGSIRFKHPQSPNDLLLGGTELTDLFLQVTINGDVALVKGILKEILEAEKLNPGAVLNHKFINEHTANFENFKAAIEQAEWDEIVSRSGIERDQIRAAAELIIKSERIICCWAMGLTQQPGAVATIQEVVNLLLVKGSLGKPGAGVCPVRGHSNVQGDRTMGVFEQPSPDFLDRLGREFGFDPPQKHGLDTVDSIKAMHAGRAKVFFAMGGNFLSATPDTRFTADALSRCNLTVHVSTKLNRAHLVTGKQALILPCLGRTETDVQASGTQFVTTENSMGVVQGSRGILPPASTELRSEPALIAGIAAETLGARSRVNWAGLAANYDLIRDLIARVIPGFDGFNTRVRQPGGFYLPNPIRERRFDTATGKAQFTAHAIPRNSPLQPGEFMMMTIRSHDQFNTTIYGLHDRYRGIHHGRRVIMLNAVDIQEAGFSEGQKVNLTSHYRGETRVAENFVVVPYDLPHLCAATYFPEANILVPIDSVAEKSNTPTYKYVAIRVSAAV